MQAKSVKTDFDSTLYHLMDASSVHDNKRSETPSPPSSTTTTSTTTEGQQQQKKKEKKIK